MMSYKLSAVATSPGGARSFFWNGLFYFLKFPFGFSERARTAAHIKFLLSRPDCSPARYVAGVAAPRDIPCWAAVPRSIERSEGTAGAWPLEREQVLFASADKPAQGAYVFPELLAIPRIMPDERYFSIPSAEVGGDVRRNRALNCWP